MESPLNVELTDCRATVNRREPELEAASLHSAAGWSSVGRSVGLATVRRGHTHKKTAPSRGGKRTKERGGTVTERGFFLVPPSARTSEFSFVIRGANS